MPSYIDNFRGAEPRRFWKPTNRHHAQKPFFNHNRQIFKHRHHRNERTDGHQEPQKHSSTFGKILGYLGVAAGAGALGFGLAKLFGKKNTPVQNNNGQPGINGHRRDVGELTQLKPKEMPGLKITSPGPNINIKNLEEKIKAPAPQNNEIVKHETRAPKRQEVQKPAQKSPVKNDILSKFKAPEIKPYVAVAESTRIERPKIIQPIKRSTPTPENALAAILKLQNNK